MIRRNLPLVFLLWCSASWAGTFEKFSFDVMPDAPVAGEPFAIWVSVEAGSCHTLAPLLPSTNLGDHVLRVEVVIDDTCVVNPAQERIYPMPSLEAGQYTFRYAFCGVTPIGYSCTTIGEESVAVVLAGSQPRPHTVPATSLAGLSALALGVVLLAFAGLAGRRK